MSSQNERTERIAAIRERVANATEGPWCTAIEFEAEDKHDAIFIAHAREDVPWLCDRLDAALALLAELSQEFNRMPDAGLTIDDPRSQWWYETFDVRQRARAFLSEGQQPPRVGGKNG